MFVNKEALSSEGKEFLLKVTFSVLIYLGTSLVKHFVDLSKVIMSVYYTKKGSRMVCGSYNSFR